MPLQKLQFRPGVNREGTSLSNEGGWYDCDKVRFRSGYPEKIGGWAVVSYNNFLGVCRSLWNWVTLKGSNLMGVGTGLKFYVEGGGDFYDITPIREINGNTGSAGPPVVNASTITLAITNGSNVLTITDAAAEALQIGDFITLADAVALGSAGTNVTAAVLNQEYQIASTISSTSYTVYLRSAGTSINGVNFSVDPETSILTFPAGTSLSNGQKVVLLPTEVLPGGLTANTTYFVVSATGLTCKLSATLSGTPILITTTGIGQQAVYFTLDSNRTASSSVMSALKIYYQIGTGANIFTTGSGWGAGPWSPYIVATLTNPFTASDPALKTLTVTQVAHVLTDGDYVYFSSISATDVAGIPKAVLQKAFVVDVTGADTYTISTIIGDITYTPTTITTAEGGTVVVNYPTTTIPASDDRGWGTPYALSPVVGVQLRLWSQANFGQQLLFSPRGGALYVWDPLSNPNPAFTSRGALVFGTDVPAQINQIMVSDSSRIVIAFGSSELGTYGTASFDPLLIRWSAQESYTNWTPNLVTNQAGFYRLSHGSEIVSALQTRQEILVWTDSAIYSMQYLGTPYVYGFTLLADNISIVSPNAVATAAGSVYWMGVDKFYMYSGRVETLPCSVRTYIFSDINRSQFGQFFSGTNEGYSEIWWFYCSANSDVIDRYVIFNYLDRVWYYGTMGRSAWLDSPLRDYPTATTLNNLMVNHEASVNDNSTVPFTSTPIAAYVQSSDFDIEDGHNYGFVWRIIPDITFDGSSTSGTTTEADEPFVRFTVRPKQNPGANYGRALSPTVTSADDYGRVGQTTYNVQQFTEIIYSRVRGRQMAFKVESNTLGTQWQLGVPRIDVRPDGRN
jgi:hypothetical protein